MNFNKNLKEILHPFLRGCSGQTAWRTLHGESITIFGFLVAQRQNSASTPRGAWHMLVGFSALKRNIQRILVQAG